MATTIVHLVHGFKIGEDIHTEVEIRSPTVGDFLGATADSERVFQTPDGPQVLANAVTVGTHMICRQIVRVGTYDGVVIMRMLEGLTPSDLNLLQDKATELEDATMGSSEARGRDPAPQEGA